MYVVRGSLEIVLLASPNDGNVETFFFTVYCFASFAPMLLSTRNLRSCLVPNCILFDWEHPDRNVLTAVRQAMHGYNERLIR